MKKNVIRINENQLKGIVKESVKRILKENGLIGPEGLDGVKKTDNFVDDVPFEDDEEEEFDAQSEIDYVCENFGDSKVKIEGVLDLWDGKYKVSTTCDDIRKAIYKCLGRDSEIMGPEDLRYDEATNTVILKAHHHDGTNEFILKPL